MCLGLEVVPRHTLSTAPQRQICHCGEKHESLDPLNETDKAETFLDTGIYRQSLYLVCSFSGPRKIKMA